MAAWDIYIYNLIQTEKVEIELSAMSLPSMCKGSGITTSLAMEKPAIQNNKKCYFLGGFSV